MQKSQIVWIMSMIGKGQHQAFQFYIPLLLVIAGRYLKKDALYQ
jgi:hypothetical protein